MYRSAGLLLTTALLACPAVYYDHRDSTRRSDDGSGDSATPLPCEWTPCWRVADSPTLGCVDDTGETAVDCSSLSAAAGQDGTLVWPAPSMSLDGLEATDNLTGLTWWRTAFGPTDREGAITACDGLDPSEWRLPTYLELVTLVDHGHSGDPNTSPALDTSVFGGVPADWLWSSEPRVGSTFSFWVVDVSRYVTSTRVESDAGGYVLCVRGDSLPDERFRDENGVVVDRKTGLTWQNSGLAIAADWSGAFGACAALGDEWQLPTIKELATLVDRARAQDALYPVFVNPAGARYWSSTPWLHLPLWPPEVMILASELGSYDTAALSPLTPHHVRCVSRNR